MNAPVSFTLTPADPDSPAGITTHYDLGAGQLTGTSGTISTEGTTTITYWSVDAVGNEELPHQIRQIRVDKTGPFVAVPNNSTSMASPGAVSVIVSDTLSGLKDVSYWLDGAATTTTVQAVSPYAQLTVNVTGIAAGARTLTWAATDIVGNTKTGTATFTVTAPAYIPQNVYRFFNLRAGVHFYTASEAEKQNVIETLGNVYRFEGPAYTINLANPNNTMPVYRFYDIKAGVHLYTADPVERDHVITALGNVYRYEGPAYNVSTTSVNAFPVYRFYNLQAGVHFYTASEAERINVQTTLYRVYRYEGPAFYVGK